MQFATLLGGDTAGRTGDGGYLLGREFLLFHCWQYALTPSRETVQFWTRFRIN
jgi:hypothetical protein